MTRTETRLWDAVEYLKTEEDMTAYLEAALEEGDPALVAAALGDIARAKGLNRIEGLGHENLFQALSPESKPEFSTVFKIIQSLGFRLHATAVRA
ncbi:MAG: addiction module antidote protein [Desulfococcaceae bacterium]